MVSFDNPFASELGIDLGSQNTVVADRNRKILVNVPTLVAINKKDKTVYFGKEAEKKVGRVSKKFYDFISLLKDGTLRNCRDEDDSDMNYNDRMLSSLMEEFLKYVLNLALGKLPPLIQKMNKPNVVVAVSCRLEERHLRAFYDACEPLVGKLSFIYQPLGMLIGDGVNPLQSEEPSLLCDIGHGTSDYSCVSDEDNVFSQALDIAGSEMDQAVINRLAKQNAVIPEYLARSIKHEIGSAMELEEGSHLSLQALIDDKVNPCYFGDITLTDADIREALEPVICRIIDGMRTFLIELSRRNPMITTTMGAAKPKPWQYSKPDEPKRLKIRLGGGVSQLRRIDDRFTKDLKIDVIRVKEPLIAAAIGAAECAGNKELLKHYAITIHDLSDRDSALTDNADSPKLRRQDLKNIKKMAASPIIAR